MQQDSTCAIVSILLTLDHHDKGVAPRPPAQDVVPPTPVVNALWERCINSHLVPCGGVTTCCRHGASPRFCTSARVPLLYSTCSPSGAWQYPGSHGVLRGHIPQFWLWKVAFGVWVQLLQDTVCQQVAPVRRPHVQGRARSGSPIP